MIACHHPSLFTFGEAEMKLLTLSISILLVLAGGCSRSAEQKKSDTARTAKPATNAVARTGQQTNATDYVIMEVNGLPTTRRQYTRYLNMMMLLFENKNPKATEADKRAMRSKIRKGIIKKYLQRQIIQSKINTFSSGKEKPGVRSRITRQYARIFAQKGEKFETLLEKVSKAGYRNEFLQELELDVRLNSHIETVFSNRLTVTAAELQKIKANVADFNKTAAATNAVTLKLANELIQRINKGENFAALADRYSQDKDRNPGGDMGECTEGDFPDEADGYWANLQKIEEGKISGVLESSDGYEIVRVNRKVPPNESLTGGVTLKLSRIFLRRAYQFADQSDEDFKMDILREKREEVLKDFIKSLMKGSKVKYPKGKKALLK